MIKGDTALDMRGRCSAGQKVCLLLLTGAVSEHWRLESEAQDPTKHRLRTLFLWK